MLPARRASTTSLGEDSGDLGEDVVGKRTLGRQRRRVVVTMVSVASLALALGGLGGLGQADAAIINPGPVTMHMQAYIDAFPGTFFDVVGYRGRDRESGRRTRVPQDGDLVRAVRRHVAPRPRRHR